MSTPSTVYGTVIYGLPLYGYLAPEDTDNLRWGIEVDWDNDGNFDGVNEADYCTDLTTRRGRENLLDESGTGFKSVEVGKASLTLENDDRRYDPRNTSSPLYPNILPGRLIRITVTDELDGTTYPIFFGKITDIQPIGRRGEMVRIEAEDGIRWLLDQTVSVETLVNQSVDDAITDILTNAQWPVEWGYALDNSPDYIPYFWTVPGTVAWNAIKELTDYCFGTAFVAADGQLKFYSRQRLTAPVATWTDPMLLKSVQLPQPWENVRNMISIVVHPVDPLSLATLWSLTQQPRLANGESITLFGEFAVANVKCAADNVISPVAGTDYNLTTNPDGGGTNYNASCTVTSSVYSTAISVTITNNAGVPVYLANMQVRGYPVFPTDTVTVQSINSTSIGTYGPKRFEINNAWMQIMPLAQILLGEIAPFFEVPLDVPTVQMEASKANQFAVDLFDRITYQSTKLGFNTNFAIGYIEHQWISETGQAVRTTFKLEPYYYEQGPAAGTFWVFPTNIGTTSYFGA